MIITKIEIDNFGKYNNFTLDLNTGLNVVLGQNEAGKSTLCAFLYAMFYGLPNESKKLGIREDARKRYLPWSGDAMAGSVYFEHDGRSYILSRKFAKTKRGDKVSLKDATTWEEINDIAADDIGRKFLGLGEGGFLKTLFISQLGAVISSDGDDEVLKKLSNLGQSGEEDTSYQAASAAIFKAQHEIISKSERAGILPRLEQEKEQLEYELTESKRVSEKFRNDIILQNQLKQEAEQLTEKLAQLNQQKELAKKHELVVKMQKSKNELNILNERKLENDKRIEEQQKKLEDYDKQSEKYKFAENISQSDLIALAQTENEVNTIKEELKDINASKERLELLKKQHQELLSKNKSAVNIKMLIIAVAILVLTIVFSITLSLAYLFILPVGIFFGITSFKSKFSKEQKEDLAALEDEIKLLEEEINIEKFNEINNKLAKKQKQIDTVLLTTGATDVHQLAQFIADRNQLVQNITAVKNELSLLLETQKQIKEDLKRISVEDIEIFSDEVYNYNGKTTEEIDLLITELHTKQLDNQREYENLRYRVEEATSGVRSSDIILTEIAETEEKLELYNFHYKALALAQEALFRSYSEIKQGFAPVLNEYSSEIVNMLTNGKYSEMKVSDDYKIKLKENREFVDAEFLSSGTYDILYFALRLGIAKVIFDDKIPMLILDDTFLQMDDIRAKRTADYLNNNSIAEQIIYFTCHESQADLFGNNANRIILN
ncbi:MAG: AAA family ATPase [Clostridia bacterium]|nr:AAA family ATPase [Clostridia bacterium]